MPPSFVPEEILAMLSVADASWRPVLSAGLRAIAEATPDYLPALVTDEYLPTKGRLFAAFSLPFNDVRYVLVGEGPYPRADSATGVCFMDGAVTSLWSEKGLSKQVNRATSLRNFIKMLLVAKRELSIGQTNGDAIMHISSKARAVDSPFIQTLPELQANLIAHGFLLLNATLVFRPHVPPIKDAKAWQPFLHTVLSALADRADKKERTLPTLVLWGKIAEQLSALPPISRFPKAVAEHPYNLTFIANPAMQALFGPMDLLIKR